MTENLSEKARASARASGELVNVPEWGLQVRMKGQTAAFSLWAQRQRKAGKTDPEMVMPEALSRSLRHPETGARLFTVDEIRELMEDDDQGVIDRLGRIFLRRSGLDAAAVERAERDFTEAPVSDSSTGLPSDSAAP